MEENTDDFFLLIENDHNEKGFVDLYESLAAIVIFSGMKFEEKIQYIFNLFDFDESGSIERKELYLRYFFSKIFFFKQLIYNKRVM